jgi:hypothetical protein
MCALVLHPTVAKAHETEMKLDEERIQCFVNLIRWIHYIDCMNTCYFCLMKKKPGYCIQFSLADDSEILSLPLTPHRAGLVRVLSIIHDVVGCSYPKLFAKMYLFDDNGNVKHSTPKPVPTEEEDPDDWFRGIYPTYPTDRLNFAFVPDSNLTYVPSRDCDFSWFRSHIRSFSYSGNRFHDDVTPVDEQEKVAEEKKKEKNEENDDHENPLDDDVSYPEKVDSDFRGARVIHPIVGSSHGF